MAHARLTDWKCPDKVMMGNMFAAMVKKYGAEPPYLEDTGGGAGDGAGRAEEGTEGQKLGDGNKEGKKDQEDVGDDEKEEHNEDSKGEGEQAK